jgi:lysophospholipase L1-like esterase
MVSHPLSLPSVYPYSDLMWISIIFIGLALLVLGLFVVTLSGSMAQEGKNKRMIKAVAGSTYFARTNEFKIYNRFAKPGGIVFVGDSLTQRYPLNEFYPGFHLYNRGIDGDTTEGVFKRLELSIFDLKPSIVVLQIGTNDLQVAGLSKDATIANIQHIVRTIQTTQPLIKIILVSLYPVNLSVDKLVNKFIVGPRTNENIQTINHALEKIQGVTYVDAYPHLLNEDKELNLQFSKDGLHLSLAGYATITPLIRNAIDKLL